MAWPPSSRIAASASRWPGATVTLPINPYIVPPFDLGWAIAPLDTRGTTTAAAIARNSRRLHMTSTVEPDSRLTHEGVVIIRHRRPYDLERVGAAVDRRDVGLRAMSRHHLVGQEIMLQPLD